MRLRLVILAPLAGCALLTQIFSAAAHHYGLLVQIARALRKQRGPPFREVTIELPFNDAGFLETTIVYPNTDAEPSNPLVRSTNAIAILLHPWSRAGGNANDPYVSYLVSAAASTIPAD